ncbi:MAG: hypothetical protein CMJ64_09875 [Planctomycetaceae bacterium]|nr:hypothetical protein [Planctomycetaceae bacterium]
MSLFTIHKVRPQTECVEFSHGEDDAPVIVGLNEFIKLVRMELRKAEHASRRRAAPTGVPQK